MKPFALTLALALTCGAQTITLTGKTAVLPEVANFCIGPGACGQMTSLHHVTVLGRFAEAERSNQIVIGDVRGVILACDQTDERVASNCKLRDGYTLEDAMTAVSQSLWRPFSITPYAAPMGANTCGPDGRPCTSIAFGNCTLKGLPCSLPLAACHVSPGTTRKLTGKWYRCGKDQRWREIGGAR